MKVLAINGSARKAGNTAILLHTVGDVLKEAGIDVEIVSFAEQIIEPCRACWACSDTGQCAHQEDPFPEIFKKMEKADGILLGSPVYAANVTANMQAFLERAAHIADTNPGFLAHKAGAAVVAARRDGALGALDTMNHFFLTHEMYIAGSLYWNVAYGQLPGDVRYDPEGMATMKSLGHSLVYLLRSLKGVPVWQRPARIPVQAYSNP